MRHGWRKITLTPTEQFYGQSVFVDYRAALLSASVSVSIHCSTLVQCTVFLHTGHIPLSQRFLQDYSYNHCHGWSEFKSSHARSYGHLLQRFSSCGVTEMTLTIEYSSRRVSNLMEIVSRCFSLPDIQVKDNFHDFCSRILPRHIHSGPIALLGPIEWS